MIRSWPSYAIASITRRYGACDANRDIDLVMINRPGDLRIPILIKVGIVGPAESKPTPLISKDARVCVRSIQPASLKPCARSCQGSVRSGSRSLRLGPFRYRSGFLNFGA